MLVKGTPGISGDNDLYWNLRLIHLEYTLMIELIKILEGMTPDYLSELFVKADNPYDTRDKCKSIQPLKRTIA